MNRSKYKWDRDITPEEIKTDIEIVLVFDESGGNPIMKMLEYVSKVHGGDERTNVIREGDAIVSSYRIFY